MKILIDLTSLADNFSGIERYAASLSLEMLKDKRNNYILVFKESVHPWFQTYASAANVRVVVLKRCHKLLFNQIRLPLAIYKLQADCYLFLAFPVPVLLFKRNMISTIHDICCWDCPETMNHVSSIYFRISHMAAMLKCRAIITISKFSEDRIVDRFRFDREKLWMIHCGVDEKFFLNSGESEKWMQTRKKYKIPGKYILSLSTLEPRKNLPLLIRAYRRLVLEEDISVSLVLAGRKGWKMENLLDNIEDEVKQKIHFTGFADDEDLPVIYDNAEFFVFPSRYEGFGIPPLEAMACGTPVLSSDAASLPEILGEYAVYFENNNGFSLYEKLKMLIHNSPVREADELKKQAKKYNWSEQAGILLDHIQTL